MILSSASDAYGRRTKSNGAVRVSKSVRASESGMIAYCDVPLAKEGVTGLRPRYPRGWIYP